MREKKITQSEVGSKLGVERNTVNRKLNCGLLRVTDLITICDMLGLEVEIREKKINRKSKRKKK